MAKLCYYGILAFFINYIFVFSIFTPNFTFLFYIMPLGMDDIDLVIKKTFKRNKNKAFKLIYDHYYSFLVYTSIKYTNDLNVCEDIIQDIFLKIADQKLWVNIHSYKNFLFLSVKNASINYINRKRTVNVDIPDIIEIDTIDERVEEIKQHMNTLPASCKDIFQKRILEGWGNEAIAYDKSISVNTVKTHLQKAKKIIHAKMS